LIKEIVSRYKEENSIIAWQVENEPFFSFGQCPKIDENFLKEEVALVKSLDLLKRQVIISDTGEWSLWLKPAKIGDVVGITIYKKVWSKEWKRYFNFYIPAVFYRVKAGIIEKFFSKKVICIELQAEPWGPSLLYDLPLEEQEKTMNLEQFKKNIKFARKTGIKEFYLWGSEWWFYLKEKHNNDSIWNEAVSLFKK
jgi:hypothetical protein